MERLDVLCSRPVLSGSLPDQGLGYMLVTYIEGEDAAEALPRLPVGEQESIGIHDGRELRKIHRASVPDEAEPCHDRILARLRSYRQDYEACGVCLDRGRELLEFLQGHIGLTEGRPSVLQHHDYHAGNLIVHDGEPDGGFWQLYALYIGLVCLSSVPWNVRVRPAETADMLKRIGKAIDDHEGFSRCKPFWYPG